MGLALSMEEKTLKVLIEQGAVDLGLGLSPAVLQSLVDYLLLLERWNRGVNLTAVRSLPEMVTHHILDCLAVVPPLRDLAAGRFWRIADVGTGAGLPGLVLAALCPNFVVTCIDSVEKKIAFVQQAIGVMRLNNVSALAARVEGLAGPYDVVSCRAFASSADVVALTGHLLGAEGFIAAMKGPRLAQEVTQLPSAWQLTQAYYLQVPGLEEARSLAIIRRAA